MKLHQFLPARKDGAGWILTTQDLRSASSIGASIEWAQGQREVLGLHAKIGHR
jgi:hypothetical protein